MKCHFVGFLGPPFHHFFFIDFPSLSPFRSAQVPAHYHGQGLWQDGVEPPEVDWAAFGAEWADPPRVVAPDQGDCRVSDGCTPRQQDQRGFQWQWKKLDSPNVESVCNPEDAKLATISVLHVGGRKWFTSVFIFIVLIRFYILKMMNVWVEPVWFIWATIIRETVLFWWLFWRIASAS